MDEVEGEVGTLALIEAEKHPEPSVEALFEEHGDILDPSDELRETLALGEILENHSVYMHLEKHLEQQTSIISSLISCKASLVSCKAPGAADLNNTIASLLQKRGVNIQHQIFTKN